MRLYSNGILFLLLLFSACKNPGKKLVIIEPTSAIGKKKGTRPLFECFIGEYKWQPSTVGDSLLAATTTWKQVGDKDIFYINAENMSGTDSLGSAQILSIRMEDFSGVKTYEKEVSLRLQNTIKSKGSSQSMSYIAEGDDLTFKIEKFDSLGMLLSGSFEAKLHQLVPGNDSEVLSITKGIFENVPVIKEQ